MYKLLLDEVKLGYVFSPIPIHKYRSNGKDRLIITPSKRLKRLQKCILRLLERYFDDFEENVIAYKKSISIHREIEKIRDAIADSSKQKCQIIRLDLQDFFGSIDHGMLLDILRERIQDKELFKTIKKLIKIPVIQGRQRLERESIGLYQGDVLSPMLSNIFMDKYFDKPLNAFIEEHHLKCFWRRYADDIILISKPEDLASIRLRIDLLLGNARLKVNSSKTSIVDIKKQGVTFLGYSFLLKGSKLELLVSDSSRNKFLRRMLELINFKIGKNKEIDRDSLRKEITMRYQSHFRYFSLISNYDSYTLPIISEITSWTDRFG